MNPVSPSLCVQIEGHENHNSYTLRVNPYQLQDCTASIKEKKNKSHSIPSFGKVVFDPDLVKMEKSKFVELFLASHPTINTSLSKQDLDTDYTVRVSLAAHPNRHLDRTIYLKGECFEGKYRIHLHPDHMRFSKAEFKPANSHSDEFDNTELKVEHTVKHSSSEQIRHILATDPTQFLVQIEKTKQASLPALTLQLHPHPLTAKQPPQHPQGVFQSLPVKVQAPQPPSVKDPSPSSLTQAPTMPASLAAKLPFAIASFNAKDPKIPSLLPKSAADIPVLNSCSNTRDLARAMKAGSTDPTLPKIAEGVIKEFRPIGLPTESEIQEVTPLPEVVTPDLCKIILGAFGIDLKVEVVDTPAILKALTDLFNKFQRATYQQGILAATQNPNVAAEKLLPDNSFQALTPAVLMRVMAVLKDRLDPIHRDKHSTELPRNYLEAMVALLNAMIAAETDGMRRDRHHDPYYDCIAAYDDHQDLDTAYFANCAKQGLVLIGNDESKAHSFWRRSWLVISGLAKIAKSIDLKQPWMAAGALDAIPDFREAFKFKQWQKDWYLQLRFLHRVIVEMKPEELINFSKAIESEPKKIKEEWDCQNPFFVRGFIELQWELLTSPNLSTGVGIEAIKILEKICATNQNAIPDKGIFTIEEKKYAPRLCAYAVELLYNCTLHPNEAVRKQATESVDTLRRMGATLPKVAIPFEDKNFPSQLFQKAMQTVAPLHFSLKYVQNYLALDDQMEEAAYYIPLEAHIGDATQSKPLDKMLQDIFGNKGPNSKAPRVVVVTGEAGSGKSFFAKLIALEQSKQYNPIPHPCFYFGLQRLTNPTHNMIHEGLERNGVTKVEEIRELEQMEATFFIDSYDEMHFSHNGLENLLLTNKDQLQHFPKARFVFFCRKGFCDKEWFMPPPSYGPLQELKLTPFIPAKIFSYAWNFTQIQERRGERQVPDWTFENKAKALDILMELGMTEEISNPFLLAVTMRIFPAVIEKLKVEYQEKHKAQEPEFKDLLRMLKGRLENELLTALACSTAHREHVRLLGMPKANKLSAEEILTFQTRAAKQMTLAKTWNFSFPLDETEKKHFEVLFKDLPEDKIKSLLEACFVKRENKYGFRHAKIQEYFASVCDLSYGTKAGENRLAELITFLKKDVYNLKLLLL